MLSLKNAIRTTNLNVYMDYKNVKCVNCKNNNTDKLSIENIHRLSKFLDNYQHPDLPIEITLFIEDFSNYDFFYDVTSLLINKENSLLKIESSFSQKLDKKTISLITSAYRNIYYTIRDFHKKELENLISLNSKKNSCVVELVLDENNIENLLDFKLFYDVLKIRNTYKIDFFSLKKNPNKFVKDVIISFDSIIKSDRSLRYINEIMPNRSTFCPRNELSFSLTPNGMITHCGINDINKEIILCDLNKDEHIINNNFKDLLNIKQTSKCKNCIAFNHCKGGCYAIQHDKNLESVFCDVMVGLNILKKKFLTGGYNEKICN